MRPTGVLCAKEMLPLSAAAEDEDDDDDDDEEEEEEEEEDEDEDEEEVEEVAGGPRVTSSYMIGNTRMI
jgi:hypothetical protein